MALYTFVEQLFTHHFCGAKRSLIILIFALAERATEMDPRSDSGRESVSSQWWEGVDKKVLLTFVLLSLGGRRQRKADNQ